MRFARLLQSAAACTLAATVAVGCAKSDANKSGDTAAMAAGTSAGSGTASTSNVAWNESGTFNGSYTKTFSDVQPVAMRTFSGNQADAVAGRQAFLKYNCVGCHGGLAGGAMGPSLRDTTWKFGGSDEQIMSTLHNGRPAGMPAWKGKIADKELMQIVAYIHSMRTPQEPTFFFSATDTSTIKPAFLAGTNQ
jgi:cbb3-type cytochrome c oxidase subunit III